MKLDTDIHAAREHTIKILVILLLLSKCRQQDELFTYFGSYLESNNVNTSVSVLEHRNRSILLSRRNDEIPTRALVQEARTDTHAKPKVKRKVSFHQSFP